MTVVLIANIGSRDVQVNPDLLPEHLRDSRNQVERQRGLYLQQQYQALKPHLELAIIRKALTYVLEHEGQIDQIVLIASDQANPDYDASDTIETAKVAQLLIRDDRRFAQTTVDVWPLRDGYSNHNPADVDAVMRALKGPLQELAHGRTPTVVYLEVTGGTAAMSEGLLLAGTIAFQQRAVALYIAPKSEMPHRLAVGKKLLGGPLRDVLLAHIDHFQYAAALQAFMAYEPFMASNDTVHLVRSVLRHADSRINLDFETARSAIRGLDANDSARHRRFIETMYNDTHNRNRAHLLGEVLQVARVRYATHSYADFLTQLVRFLENSLRFLCLEHGVEFVNWNGHSDDNGAKIAPVWAKRHAIERPNAGQAGLQYILKTTASADQRVLDLLHYADSMEQIIRLRNSSTHSFQGISHAALETAFGDNPDTIIDASCTIYQTITGKRLADNPYLDINSLLHTLLGE